MAAFAGQNLTDHFPPPHGKTFAAPAAVDLMGQTGLPQNATCQLIVEWSAAGNVVLVMYGGSTVTLTSAGAEIRQVRGAFKTITSSTSAVVTAFWQ